MSFTVLLFVLCSECQVKIFVRLHEVHYEKRRYRLTGVQRLSQVVKLSDEADLGHYIHGRDAARWNLSKTNSGLSGRSGGNAKYSDKIEVAGL